MARNAGTTLATSATVISSTPTAANTAGSFAGWIGYLIAGFIGACILIAIGRAIKSRRA